MIRKPKVEWENGFPLANWDVMDRIENAQCKLCTFHPKRKALRLHVISSAMKMQLVQLCSWRHLPNLQKS